jgi:hypothetical protein
LTGDRRIQDERAARLDQVGEFCWARRASCEEEEVEASSLVNILQNNRLKREPFFEPTANNVMRDFVEVFDGDLVVNENILNRAVRRRVAGNLKTKALV